MPTKMKKNTDASKLADIGLSKPVACTLAYNNTPQTAATIKLATPAQTANFCKKPLA